MTLSLARVLGRVLRVKLLLLVFVGLDLGPTPPNSIICQSSNPKTHDPQTLNSEPNKSAADVRSLRRSADGFVEAPAEAIKTSAG